MLHLLPDSAPQAAPLPYAEAVSRLASVRHAMRLVDPTAGPADDLDDEIAGGWDQAGAARQRCFDRNSGRMIGAAAAGLEALLVERPAHAQASTALVEEIRRELRDVAGVILS